MREIFKFFLMIIWFCNCAYAGCGSSCPAGKQCSNPQNPNADTAYCTPCSEGYYCDGTGISGTACNSLSGGAFPFSDQDTQNVIGAKSKYECYKKLDADSSAGTGHGLKCKDENDTDIEYSENGLHCRQYYRESGTYVSCDGDAGTDSSGTPISTPNNTGYHMEESGCYKNTRKCSKFIISSGDQNQCIISGQTQRARISSDAVLTWDVGTRQWQDNSNCKCRVEGDFSDRHCNGFQEFSNTGMVNSSTVSAQLIFRNNSSYGATTHCTGCLAGYYANGDTEDSFNCVPAPQGYYSTGCGTKWTETEPLYSNSNTISCWGYGNILKPCYAGMTTSDSGADSVQDCHYTDQTQFCDAWGCTSYSDLVGSNGNNWWWYMRESTGSSGSVDSSNDEIPIDVTPFD